MKFSDSDEPVIKAEFHINGVKQNRVLNAFKFGLLSAFPQNIIIYRINGKCNGIKHFKTAF